MSQYTEFFIRKDDMFVPLGSYGRGSKVAEVFGPYAPWEKVRILTEHDIESVLTEIRLEREHTERAIADIQEQKNLICSFNNSVEDKLEALGTCDELLDDYRAELDSLVYAREFASILNDIRYENETEGFDGIYIGTEIGEPTVDDIF